MKSTVCAVSTPGFLALLLTVSLGGAIAPPTSALDDDSWSAYEGRYRQQGLESLIRIYLQDGQLKADVPGRHTITLEHIAGHEFRVDPERRVVFEVEGDRATGYTFHGPQGAQTGTWIAERKPGDVRVEPRILTAADGTKISAEFGRFAVPENRTKPDSNPIELAFVRLKSPAPNPRAPLVYLAGGPGGSSTFFADDPRLLTRWVPYLKFCDVVFLDQRGTGRSEPSMRWQSDAPIPEGVFVDYDVALRHVIEMSRQAVRDLRNRGIDLKGYTTLQSAADLADLCHALGVPKISLLGFSYGTHLGLATLKYHSEIVENAVLCGVEGLDQTYKLPLNMDTQFHKLALLVEHDERIRQVVPDLMALLKRVLDRLDREPMVVEVNDPRTRQPIRVPIGRLGLCLILRFDIGDASDLPVFPRLLHSIDQGDPNVLRWFVQKRIGIVSGVSGMGIVMDNASGVSPHRRARIEAQARESLFGNVMNSVFLAPGLAEVWGVPDLGPEYRAPLVTDTRTLFLTGTLDWNTPPYQAEQIRWGFVNGTHLIVENAGHEQILPQPEIQRAIRRFLQGEDVHDVKVVLPPLRFVPIRGFDPSVTHPSVDPKSEIFRLAVVEKNPGAASALARELMEAVWDDARELNNMAWALVTESGFEGGFNDLALEMAQRANELTERKNWSFVDTLAHVRFARGEIEESIELERLALVLVGSDPAAAEVKAALERFEKALD